MDHLLKLLEDPYSYSSEIGKDVPSATGTEEVATPVSSQTGCGTEDRKLVISDYMKRPPIETLDVRVT